MEQEPAAATKSQERLTASTLKGIEDEIKMLNQKKAPGLDLITARMLKELRKEGPLTQFVYSTPYCE